MTEQGVTEAGGVAAYVPGVAVVKGYKSAWLAKDVVAGLVLSALLVPQGMAYAELAGLPAITGLYTSMLCLLGYAIFGPSRVLVLGPDSSLGPMIAATIAPLVLADGDPARAVALASMLAVIVGVLMTVAGLAKFGFVADLLSKPTQIGYMNGLALTIVIGQLPKLFGFSVDADGLIDEAKGFVSGVVNGDVNGTAAAVGVVSLVGIVVLQRLLPQVPAVLVAVVLASLAVKFWDLAADGVDTIGVLPQGFPPFTLPTVCGVDAADADRRRAGDRIGRPCGHDVDRLLVRGPAGRTRARQPGDGGDRRGEHRRRVLPGLPGEHQRVSHRRRGAGRVEVSADRCRRCGGDRADPGAGAGLMQYVPQPTLGAVVIAAALSLADLTATRRLWHQRRMEFGLSMAAFLGVALLGVLPGILIAVALSILNVFRRLWWPYQTTLGRATAMPVCTTPTSTPTPSSCPAWSSSGSTLR